ncbi:hypothetical protein ACEYXF_14480 [Streptomyces asiaticus]|uniref:hypothetical protein n=1 Tax=Streptomyces asiaticus TaxID=114695 RepID=UPI0039BDEE5E
METTDLARLDTYFGRIVQRFQLPDRPASLLVTHLLAERPAFVRAVAGLSDLRAVLPKPKSISPTARREVERSFPCDALSRGLFANPDSAVFLVQAEILAALRTLARGNLAPGMHEVSSEDRATIAATWLNYYNR